VRFNEVQAAKKVLKTLPVLPLFSGKVTILTHQGAMSRFVRQGKKKFKPFSERKRGAAPPNLKTLGAVSMENAP